MNGRGLSGPDALLRRQRAAREDVAGRGFGPALTGCFCRAFGSVGYDGDFVTAVEAAAVMVATVMVAANRQRFDAETLVIGSHWNEGPC